MKKLTIATFTIMLTGVTNANAIPDIASTNYVQNIIGSIRESLGELSNSIGPIDDLPESMQGQTVRQSLGVLSDAIQAQAQNVYTGVPLIMENSDWPTNADEIQALNDSNITVAGLKANIIQQRLCFDCDGYQNVEDNSYKLPTVQSLQDNSFTNAWFEKFSQLAPQTPDYTKWAHPLGADKQWPTAFALFKSTKFIFPGSQYVYMGADRNMWPTVGAVIDYNNKFFVKKADTALAGQILTTTSTGDNAGSLISATEVAGAKPTDCNNTNACDYMLMNDGHNFVWVRIVDSDTE